VKRYAAEFCQVASLRKASRDQIASFISHLSELAAQGRDQLVEKLASYGPYRGSHEDAT
jgi:hypothetical protein